MNIQNFNQKQDAQGCVFGCALNSSMNCRTILSFPASWFSHWAFRIMWLHKPRRLRLQSFWTVFPGALSMLGCKLHLEIHKVSMVFPLGWTWKRPCAVRRQKSCGIALSNIPTTTPTKYLVKVQDPETVKFQSVQISYF